MNPAGLRYTKDHEWIRVDGSRGQIGITAYAQEQLGEVVYVELPAVGTEVTQGQMFGTVESVKAVSELFSPMSGRVTEVNAQLGDHPEALNADPYQAWMITVDLSRLEEVDALMDQAAYERFLASA